MVIGYCNWFAVRELQNEMKSKNEYATAIPDVPLFSVVDAVVALNQRWDGITKYNRHFVEQCFQRFVEENYIKQVPAEDARVKKYRVTKKFKGMLSDTYEKMCKAANLINAQRQNEITSAKAIDLALEIETTFGLNPDWSRKVPVNMHGDGVQPQPLNLTRFPPMDGPNV